MVQFYNLLNTLSKNMSIMPGKKSRGSIEWEAAIALAKEAKRNDLLRTSSGYINGRNGESFAAGHSKRGKKGPINQDCFVIWEEFGCQEDIIFCGVFDGHGPWGHLLSKTVRELMPSTLLCHWQEAVALNEDDSDHSLEFELDKRKEQLDLWKQSYYKTCASIDQELEHYPGIDSFYSGSTALALVRQGDLLTIANVGDSRAVLATTSDDGILVATQLTTDLKPSVPDERNRIEESRGVVYSCPDEPEVHRVWMPNGKTIKGPGLAVSRAFGDYYIKDFGLISEPEIIQTTISSSDQFAILATDGVWDVISNQDAAEIVASTVRAESAKRLVEYAVCAWKQRGRSAVMDDISAVCLFFHCSTSPDRAVEETKLNKKRI